MKQLKKNMEHFFEMLLVLILVMVIIPASWVMALFTVIVLTVAVLKYTIHKIIY